MRQVCATNPWPMQYHAFSERVRKSGSFTERLELITETNVVQSWANVNATTILLIWLRNWELRTDGSMTNTHDKIPPAPIVLTVTLKKCIISGVIVIGNNSSR